MRMSTLLIALLSFGGLFGAPPEAIPSIDAEAGDLVLVTVKGEKDKVGTWKSWKTEDKVFFKELMSDTPGERQFVFQAPKKNPKPIYTIVWWTQGDLVGSETVIRITPATQLPPDQPPPTKPTSYYFLVVRKDSVGVDPNFTKLMMKDGWAQLRKDGHKIRDYPLKQAKDDLGVTLNPTFNLNTAAAVFVLATTDKESKIVRGPIELPLNATDADIVKLAEPK